MSYCSFSFLKKACYKWNNSVPYCTAFTEKKSTKTERRRNKKRKKEWKPPKEGLFEKINKAAIGIYSKRRKKIAKPHNRKSLKREKIRFKRNLLFVNELNALCI